MGRVKTGTEKDVAYMKRAIEHAEGNTRICPHECQECNHFQQLFKRVKFGGYLAHERGWCQCHDISVMPLQPGCEFFKEEIIFTIKDKQELEYLQNKLANATKIM